MMGYIYNPAMDIARQKPKRKSALDKLDEEYAKEKEKKSTKK